MKKLSLVISMIVLQLSLIFAQAPFSIGVRVGFNTSNIAEERIFSGTSSLHDANWEHGFIIGAVVDIPMSHKFALKPGFFYDRRNAEYASSFTHHEQNEGATTSSLVYIEGSTSTNWFHFPLLISYRFIPIRSFELNLDFGPYVSWGISGSNKYKRIITEDADLSQVIPEFSTASFKGDDAIYFRTDWGFKAGGGLLLFNHYYIGAHYLFGMRNLARNKQFVSNAHTREWQFTIGYNF